ncbi:CAAX amino terminal protease family [Acidisarcina polymorpha]|uniref:CAAX amino terminal protease family n=1 Tax=Acidisarcina polymorpha TaxID=2211140 RepID=A0A2Z5G402_9BACT|nr:type II CAAX endopeptidase family protein [Acidisarcina polymorpha]AXC13447.1 CAAX amino terminal protease family [Acidisarcina polymorpha]
MIAGMLHLAPSEARIFFHLLAFVLVIAAPGVGWIVAGRIKAAPSFGSRVLGYKLVSLGLFLASLAVFLLIPPATFFAAQIKNRGVTWLPSRELISALAIVLVLLTAVPALLARTNGSFQANFKRQISEIRNLLPHSGVERLWFGLAAVIAGVCEEVLYRGFLLHYLHVFPWRLNIGTSLLVACTVFGIFHLYQGVGGVLQTLLLALGLCVLFLATRSLLIPILLHVLVELRIFLVLPIILPSEGRQRTSSVKNHPDG